MLIGLFELISDFNTNLKIEQHHEQLFGNWHLVWASIAISPISENR